MRWGIAHRQLDFRLGVLYLVEQLPHCDLLKLSPQTIQFVLLKGKPLLTQGTWWTVTNVRLGWCAVSIDLLFLHLPSPPFFSFCLFLFSSLPTVGLCHGIDLCAGESRFIRRKLGSWQIKKQKLLHKIYAWLRQQETDDTVLMQVAAGYVQGTDGVWHAPGWPALIPWHLCMREKKGKVHDN